MNRYLLITLPILLFLISCQVQLPEGYEALINKDEKVKVYESFEEINPVTPVPSKFDFGLGAILKMLVIPKKAFKYSSVAPEAINRKEKNIIEFFAHKGVGRSAKLLSYARQLKEGHPYRINPFVPFFTDRPENALFSEQKVGPAALVNDMFAQKGPYFANFEIKDYEGNIHPFSGEFPSSRFADSGTMLLFDHTSFLIDDLISKPEKNLLQDIMVHEFTHIWHNEMLPGNVVDRSNVNSNKTEVGHDTMIVSNPTLAFSEGLAEAFEALYGTFHQKIISMSSKEREEFYGRHGAKLKEDLQFLINRQRFIRRNSYLYNLYDFSECTLRVVKGLSASDVEVDASIIPKEILAKLSDYDLTIEEVAKLLAFDDFQDRFYSTTNQTSHLFLRKNCDVDSPGRLESKEGFMASVIYNLIRTGALVDEELLGKVYNSQDRRRLGKSKLNRDKFLKFVMNTHDLKDINWLPENRKGRSIASVETLDERLAVFEKNYLLGFRNLVLGIMSAKATTFKELTDYYFSDKSILNDETKLFLAFQLLRSSGGKFMKSEGIKDEAFLKLFEDENTIQEKKEKIFDYLADLYNRNELVRVTSNLGQVPEVYVEFSSQLGGGKADKRMNVNLAHHMDLIDIFGKNSKVIHELAKKLDRGEYFQDAYEFYSFAERIGKRDVAEAAVTKADESMKGVAKLSEARKVRALYSDVLLR